MNFKDILKTVGTGIFKEVVPGGSAILGVLNEILPAGKQLSATATGAELAAQIDKLPESQRAKVLERQFDVEITELKEQGATRRAMLDAEAASGQSTRPKIAWGSFLITAFISGLVALALLLAVGMGKPDMVVAIGSAWPLITGILAPFIYLLRAYFGDLKGEHENRINAAQGLPAVATMAGGMLAKLLKRD